MLRSIKAVASRIALAVALLLSATSAIAADPPTPNIMQIEPLFAGMYVAAEVAISESQSVVGLTWYNNDAGIVFPEVLVAAGYHGTAPNLADALVLVEGVQGDEVDWSHLDFGIDVQSPTDVFYVIFRLPGFLGEQRLGEGPGIGYQDVEAESSVFISIEGDEWIRMVTDKRLLVDPIYADGGSGQKSTGSGRRRVLMLEAPTEAMEAEVEVSEEPVEELPVRTEMLAPYPNPFNPQVTIAFALKESADVTISIFDLRGRRVREIRSGIKPAGRYQEVWRGRDEAGRRQASGVYFIRLNAGAYERTHRVLLLK